ncbi:hemerythrin [Rhodoferax lacus]|uniref:Hemerythrin n=1 Tax=Rhodoferax lacus TaxID=2184758 RepID=A0A3E1RDC3_9BURK|nr:hemerythrin domain-containing protein [Rhodoferax lacus]RFO97359.1 hemerythrin [Rhodoferax lacus]
MTTATPVQPFKALDACHLQIQEHLSELQRMALHMQTAGLEAADRQLAGEIEAYFSSTSREHHAQEELHVFPPLLEAGSEEIKSAVRSLQQDHGFIEENWLELGPQLRAISEGNDWFQGEEFQHNVATFLELMDGHIALEESMIYPESKMMWAEAIARRIPRA